MTEDAGEYVELEVVPVDAPLTVTILVQRKGGGWTCRCCPPEGEGLPDLTARGESLGDALANLAERVQEWEEDHEDDDEYDGDDYDDGGD